MQRQFLQVSLMQYLNILRCAMMKHCRDGIVQRLVRRVHHPPSHKQSLPGAPLQLLAQVYFWTLALLLASPIFDRQDSARMKGRAGSIAARMTQAPLNPIPWKLATIRGRVSGQTLIITKKQCVLNIC